ncbi:RNA-directed DNA polymerase [Alloalcanivorax marinus]|uniref:RNA-directed DNA polymerase n=1 Tax=Alloalcanivorax marinus TaxID=1177169 RepID=UPI0019593FA7|nr:RNA-directed DNA polymerase [Alloalcanivorax marinus]MBM7332690.1 RNA-directed DNA polymerase [Alloalcanivorax marinus]
MLKELLEKGYFPAELPEPFTTRSYASAFCSSSLPAMIPYIFGKKGPKYSSKCSTFNLARRGKLRRVLSVPNPINYYHCAKSISDNWTTLETYYKKSDQSLSRPVADTNRALGWEQGFSRLSDSMLNTRSASKYILKADISNFYSSIYTHSIPWALHTKAAAKSSFAFSASIGNQIDTHVRNCQEMQTKGVPIGPDTSFAIAELILTSIDKSLTPSVGSKYHRYIDDFEFGCTSFQQAESTLAKLQEALEQYELTLNSSKTKIIELPCPLDPIWLHELKNYHFRNGRTKQRNDLLHYFDLVMDYLGKFPDDPIVKYAILKSSSRLTYTSNWPAYQSIILQWSIAEPGILPIALDFIKFYESNGYLINKSELQDTLEFLIAEHAPMGHTSEVCYAIFGMMLFGLTFSDSTVKVLSEIENPFIALLTLDAQQRKLISSAHTFTLWRSLMTPSELTTSNWLLAYEALVKGWLPSSTGKDYVSSDPGFKYLKAKNVFFYDESSVAAYSPTPKYWALKDITAEQLKYVLEPSNKVLQPTL